MYMVTVRLISSIDLPKAAAMVGMAGKYIAEEKGLNHSIQTGSNVRLNLNTYLNNPAKATIATINHFSRFV